MAIRHRGKVQAVVAVIARDGRFLVGKRAMWKPAAPGYWCTCSGGIEWGESEAKAAVREAREEFGLLTEPVRKLAVMPTRAGDALLHWWLLRISEGSPEASLASNEHSELRWVTLEEMKGLSPFFEEDLEIYGRLATP